MRNIHTHMLIKVMESKTEQTKVACLVMLVCILVDLTIDRR